MTINIRQKLTEMDAESYNEYSLVDNYYASKLTEDKKKTLAKILTEDVTPKQVFDYITEEITPELKATADKIKDMADKVGDEIKDNLPECADVSHKELTEKMWKLTIPVELAKEFRDATESEDDDRLYAVRDAMTNISNWIGSQEGFEDLASDFESLIDDMSYLNLDEPDEEYEVAFGEDEGDYVTTEDEVNYILSEFYDLLDAYSIFLPTIVEIDEAVAVAEKDKAVSLDEIMDYLGGDVPTEYIRDVAIHGVKGFLIGTPDWYDGDEHYQYFVSRKGNPYILTYGSSASHSLTNVDYLNPKQIDRLSFVDRSEDGEEPDIHIRSIIQVDKVTESVEDSIPPIHTVDEVLEGLVNNADDKTIDRYIRLVNKLSRMFHVNADKIATIEITEVTDPETYANADEKEKMFSIYNSILPDKKVISDGKSVFFANVDDAEEYMQFVASSPLNEGIVKQGNKWVNKGKEGTHGEFDTKAEAREQQKAIFANKGL